MTNPVCRLGLVAAVAAAIAGVAHADESMIKYRQSVMKAIGGHTAASAAIVKGDVPFKDDLAAHARAIAELSQIAEHIFPEDSADGDTKALPAIWEQPDKFQERQEAFRTAAADFADAAGNDPKAAAAALGDLGKACKACHDDFRKED